jgi:hypothetical protein
LSALKSITFVVGFAKIGLSLEFENRATALSHRLEPIQFKVLAAGLISLLKFAAWGSEISESSVHLAKRMARILPIKSKMLNHLNVPDPDGKASSNTRQAHAARPASKITGVCADSARVGAAGLCGDRLLHWL